MEKKIYLVVGHSGQWEDSREWIAKAFYNKDKAEKHLAALSSETERLNKTINESRESSKRLSISFSGVQDSNTEKLDELDPQACFDGFYVIWYKIKELEVDIEE